MDLEEDIREWETKRERGERVYKRVKEGADEDRNYGDREWGI